MLEGAPQTEESRLEQAKKLILDVNSKEYIQGHNFGSKEQAAVTPVVLRYQIGNQELVAIGAPHTYTNKPEHPVLKKIRDEFGEYVQRIPKEKRIAMVEGFHNGQPRTEATLEESAKRGESHMLTFLANQSGSEVISPEAPDEKILADLLEKGMTGENIALFHVLRALRGGMQRGEVRHGVPLPRGRVSVAIARIEQAFRPGWTRSDYSEEVAGQILSEAVPKINKAMRNVFKEDLFELSKNGEVKVVANEKIIFDSVDPSPWAGNTTVINSISRIVSDTRDSYILEKLAEAVEKGKSPFIVYGRSHIIRLKPALDYLFGNKSQTS